MPKNLTLWLIPGAAAWLIVLGPVLGLLMWLDYRDLSAALAICGGMWAAAFFAIVHTIQSTKETPDA